MALIRVEKDKFNLRSKLNELDYGHVPYEKMPAGSAVQYVQADTERMTNRFTTSSNSYQSTNYDLTISPRSPGNKILIYANLSSHANNNGYIYVRVYNVTAGRYCNIDEVGATRLDGLYESAIGGKTQWSMMPVEALDFPRSTSPQLYRLYIRAHTGTAYAGWSGTATNTNNFNFMSATEYKV